MVEIELKLKVPPERQGAVAAAMGLAGARKQRLLARYHDTADGRLAAARISLRLRKEGRVWVQTLKAPGDNAVHRLEHNVPRPGRWGAEGPPLEIALHEGTAAGDALSAALGEEPGGAEAALQVVYEADVSRRTRVVEHGEAGERGAASVELALDNGHLRAAERSAAVSELEFELKAGEPAGMVALATEALRQHGLWLSTVPKAARGERLAKGQAWGEAAKAESPRLRGKMPAAGVLRCAVAACLEQVLANASEVADGSREAEHVHQLRVGIRRLRTVLRELGDLAPGVDPAWEPTLSATFGELGEFRDRDTVSQWAAAELQAVGAPPVALPAPAGELPDPVLTVRAVAFQSLLLALLGFTLGPAEAGPESAEKPAKPVKAIGAKLAKLHRQVDRDGQLFEQLEEEAQHRVRKRLKRLRYLAELVAGLFDHDKVDRYLAQLRPAQDALGEHNDTLVALALYRDAASQGLAPAWFAVGWLTGRLPASAKSCRKALAKVSEARRFW